MNTFEKARPRTAPSRIGEKKRANELDGKHWVKFSISIWSDIRFSPDERALRHPAMFPQMLVERLIQCFTNNNDSFILDPFCGSGSTLLAAEKMGKKGIGFEIYDKFVKLASDRLRAAKCLKASGHRIIQNDARGLSKILGENTVDFCVTSPPYWDILHQRRTADSKQNEVYGISKSDIGNIASYETFLSDLGKVSAEVFRVLRPGKYFVMNVMDLRKGPEFFPLHIDAIKEAENAGFFLDDILIWDRRLDYNNLRALGYPAVFRVNKVHEFLLVFRKPFVAAKAAAA